MGFIPIFITLGAFVFLFIAIVHQSFQKKKKEFQTDLEEFIGLITRLHKELDAPGMLPEDKNLENFERHYYGLKKLPEFDNQHESLALLAKSKLVACKKALYQYQSLLTKKPYSMVASIMGHKAI
ncbi:hypothetical protein [Negadavirga shengliensis]|uniref:Uncharacterized protein n=1 Tax=Negadavirga shengliensis TaxID=1389218 RepID=A0ABV9SYA3_9BACT